jgi:hypothetical protein
MWCYTPIIPALQRQEDHEFKTTPGKVSKTLFQKQNTNKKTRHMACLVYVRLWVQPLVPQKIDRLFNWLKSIIQLYAVNRKHILNISKLKLNRCHICIYTHINIYMHI